jgi:DNA-binding NtrC family response regulator
VGQKIGRALIVEDDAILNSILHDIVEEMGFSVRTASDVEEARHAIDDEEYNLLLADLKLEDDKRAGLKLAGEVSAHHADTRIILVSGYPQPAELAPDIAFLRKPFTTTQLQRAIGSSLRH